MTYYLTAEEMLFLHYVVMEIYGEGEHAGILFEDRFYFAVERPQMSSFNVEVYPTLWLKAAALVQSIAQGHPFHNGNKRTALACLNIFLELNRYRFTLSSQEAEDFMVRIITEQCFKGNEGPIQIAELIETNSRRID